MTHRTKILATASLCVLLLWGIIPEATLACERCFGAGADSATVRAIGASMMVLIVLMGFMGGGIFSFFNRANERAGKIESDRAEADRADADRIDSDRIDTAQIMPDESPEASTRREQL